MQNLHSPFAGIPVEVGADDVEDYFDILYDAYPDNEWNVVGQGDWLNEHGMKYHAYRTKLANDVLFKIYTGRRTPPKWNIAYADRGNRFSLFDYNMDGLFPITRKRHERVQQDYLDGRTFKPRIKYLTEKDIAAAIKLIRGDSHDWLHHRVDADRQIELEWMLPRIRRKLFSGG